MQLIKSQDYQRMAWRNGGGQTAQIATGSSPRSVAQDSFDWRISLADVGRDGPYSDFSGYNRILTLVSGQGTELTAPDGNILRIDQQFQPRAFSGEIAFEGRLLDGPIQNFNLIYRANRLTATVNRLDLHHAQKLAPPATDESQLLYLAQASHELMMETEGQSFSLAQGDSLLNLAGTHATENQQAKTTEPLLMHSLGPVTLLQVCLKPLA